MTILWEPGRHETGENPRIGPIRSTTTEGLNMSTAQHPMPCADPAGPALFIDVRSPGEFAGGHLDGAHNLPLDQLAQRIALLAPDRQRELVLYCASGARSAHGCALLAQLGYSRARNGGGIGALALSSQRPVRRG